MVQKEKVTTFTEPSRRGAAMDDREHRILIEKLGAAKTSEERDRILRDLANQDKAAPGRTPRGPRRPASSDPPRKSRKDTRWRVPAASMRAVILGHDGDPCGLFFIVDAVIDNHEGPGWFLRNQLPHHGLRLPVCRRLRCSQRETAGREGSSGRREEKMFRRWRSRHGRGCGTDAGASGA